MDGWKEDGWEWVEWLKEGRNRDIQWKDGMDQDMEEWKWTTMEMDHNRSDGRQTTGSAGRLPATVGVAAEQPSLRDMRVFKNDQQMTLRT